MCEQASTWKYHQFLAGLLAALTDRKYEKRLASGISSAVLIASRLLHHSQMREHQRKTLVSIVLYSSTPTHHVVHQATEAAVVVWATPPLSSNREKEGTHKKFICSLVGSSTIADELSSKHQ